MSGNVGLKSFKPETCETIVSLLAHRAELHPDKVVYTFLPDGEDLGIQVTYRELYERSKAVAERLTAVAQKGDRALMLFPSGLEFIFAFFGCLYAGLVAVPVYPPRRNQKMDRLQAIITDCSPACVLTTAKVLTVAAPLFAEEENLRGLQFLTVNMDDSIEAKGFVGPSVVAQDLAFLQYTSGSTGTPKGVMISHENLIYNQAMIAQAFESTPDDVSVSWLPMFHDMGLIGTTLHPLFVGASSVFMSPASFLQKPLRWLKAITEFKGTALCAPNFAFELCANQISMEQKQSLDLSTVRLAVSGAEPIRASTLNQFFDAFANNGFRRDALTPTYGLAEATLMVSCARRKNRPHYQPVDAKQLAENSILKLDGGEAAQQTLLVSNGVAPLDSEIVVVDPVTKETQPEGLVGEIWVAGKHIAVGYWHNEKATMETFQAKAAGGKGPYMRTGDLGCLIDGELYITGRLKDVIIIRGRNHYPQDLEFTVQNSHVALKADSGAVFAVNQNGEEKLVVVQEVERQYRRSFDPVVVSAAIRQSVFEYHELQVHTIVFLKPGAILKTSSGKIQRSAIKQAFLDQRLEGLAADSLVPQEFTERQLLEINQATAFTREDWARLDPKQRKGSLSLFVKGVIARELNCTMSSLSDSSSLLSMGVDSLQVTQVVNRLNQQLGVNVNLELLFDAQNISELSDYLNQVLEDAPSNIPDLEPLIGPKDALLLSFAQKRIWFWDRFHEQSVVYNLPFALKLSGALDIQALALAFQQLIERHEILRTVYYEKDAYVFQKVLPESPWSMPIEDLRYLKEPALARQIADLIEIEACTPFDLMSGPLLRTQLLRLPDQAADNRKGRVVEQYILLISVHHIAADGFSLSVLTAEISELYLARLNDREPVLPPLVIQYSDYANWHRNWVRQETVKSQLAYWVRRLQNVPVLDLPTDYPRPPEKTFKGANYYFELSNATLEAVKAISRSQNVTNYMTLLAALKLLLMNYTQGEDICVGTPVAGRTRPEFESLVGFFVNTLSLRTDLSGQPSFLQLLQRVRQVTLEAFANQDVPFEHIVENLELARDLSHSPIFQVMFIYQTHTIDKGFNLAGVGVENIPCSTGTSKFDLSIEFSEVGGKLLGNVEYATDLYTNDTIARLIEHYQQLLQNVLADPTRSIAHLGIVTAAESRQVLEVFNNSAQVFPAPSLIHTYFQQQAMTNSHGVALVDGHSRLSYEELNQKANALAQFLVRNGALPSDLIGVCLPRSSNLVVALLAVLKTGAAYVPIDPNYPSARVDYMIQDSGIQRVLTETSVEIDFERHPGLAVIALDELALPTEAVANLDLELPVEGLAYVIYTSGSTGNPKGVMVSHSNAAALIQWAGTVYSKADLDGVLAATSVCFDLSIFELFVTLAYGGKVILADDVLSMGQLPARDEIVLINTVPSAINALLQNEAVPASVKVINLAGEALSASLVDEIYRRTDVARVYDLYGPSEDTTYSTVALRKPNSPATIGRPISNTYAYVLNAYGQLVPPGFSGELFLAGTGITQGYLNKEDLTAERFITNPFSCSSATSIMYRTGDLVRFMADGNLEYLGRIDHQVKVRGFRIELGEIQSALNAIAQVDDSLVVTTEDTSGNTILVAYLISESGQSSALIDLARQQLEGSLPSYMIPAIFMVLSSFPLTPNGKIDRKALPTPSSMDRVSDNLIPPRTDEEVKMAAIWCQVLGIDRVGITCNFFELGGHSLLATQCIARIRENFDVELPVKSIFTSPTIEKLVPLLEKAKPLSLLAPPVVSKVDRDTPLPLSFAQMRLWFLNQLEGGSAEYSISTSYNMPAAIRLYGDLNTAALRKAFQALVARHESLRTIFVVDDGHASQRINPPGDWFMDIRDISNLEHEEREAEILNFAHDEALRSFDLEMGEPDIARRTRLMRTRLLRCGAHEHVLLLTMHHIISDGWSVGVLLHDVAELYRAIVEGTAPQLPDLQIQYADYAAWQREWMSGPVFEHQMNYWKQQLAGVPVLELPTDHPRPPIMTFSGAAQAIQIDSDLVHKLNHLSREQGTTLFMTLLAIFYTLLHRYSGQTDLCVGTPVANRSRPEFEPLIGCFVNSLSLRAELDGNHRFIDLLKQVQHITLEAYNHQDIPFERLVDALGVTRDKSHSPLFQVMFTLQNASNHSSVQLPGIELDIMPPIAETAKFDLTLNLEETKKGLTGIIEFNTDLFEPETIHRMALHFERIIEQVVEHPTRKVADFDLLGDEERSLLLEKWNQAPFVNFYQSTIHQHFEAMVAKFPLRTAISASDGEFSYEVVNQRANRLARYLLGEGVKPGQLIAIGMDRSSDVIIAILAVLKAGGGYVPVDLANPVSRNEFILADSGTELLVTKTQLQDEFPQGRHQAILVDAIEDKLAGLSPEDLNLDIPYNQRAYVIYTSGTTGKPKGVLIPHSNVIRLFSATDQWFGFNEKDVWTQFHSVAFDFSVWEIWGALFHGGRLVMVPVDTAKSSEDFYNLVAQEQVTVLNQTPSAFTQFIRIDEHQSSELSLRYVIFGGEALDFSALDTWENRHGLEAPQLINMYGITETTVHVTYHRVNKQDLHKRQSLIGRPIPDLNLYILDAYRKPVPIGVPGELYVGGRGLALGYLNRDELTAERFVPNTLLAQPLSSEGLYNRLYRTGDVGRFRPNGVIEYLGRCDDQVKIRGYRIELGEIESALSQYPAVREAVVLAREDNPGDKRLIAYLLTDSACEKSEIVDFLRVRLPAYMIPVAFITMSEFPLTSNGKINKKALPKPDDATLRSSQYVAPRNDTEACLVDIWKEVLNLERIGVTDNFFELGGHSLLATQVVSRVRENFNVELPLSALFDVPTIENIALHLLQAELESADDLEMAELLAEIEGLSEEDLKNL